MSKPEKLEICFDCDRFTATPVFNSDGDAFCRDCNDQVIAFCPGCEEPTTCRPKGDGYECKDCLEEFYLEED